MYQGNNDGPFNAASFFRPQGLAFDKNSNCLYIADTDNHLVRKTNLVERTVTTIAGTGSKGGPKVTVNREAQGTQVSLNSPWDPILMGGLLYVVMGRLSPDMEDGPRWIPRRALHRLRCRRPSGWPSEQGVVSPALWGSRPMEALYYLSIARPQPSGLSEPGPPYLKAKASDTSRHL